jgi:ribosome-binding protein aMBF1 (putative translation factor)
MTKMIPVKEIGKTWMKNPKFKEAYDALEDEFVLAEALIDARSQAKLTQQDVAERMDTTQAYVAKMEGGRVNPSLKTLQRFAAATGTKLKISFEPDGDTVAP